MALTPQQRKILAFVLLLLSALIGGIMHGRAQNEALWGHLPLALYLTAWGGILLLLADWRPALRWSIATGVLLGLGFPGYLPAPFLLLVAWVPLLAVQRTATARAAFGYGFNAFFLYNVLASFWVTNTALAAGLIAVVVNSLLMCVPWMLFHWTSRRAPRVAYLALAAYWISFEYLHYNWDLNWPWLTLGNGFAQFPALVQWYEWTGVLGGSAWILATNALVLHWWLRPVPRPRPYAVLAVLLLPPAISLLRYTTYAPPPGETVMVASIQPNFEPHFEKFSGGAEEQLGVFLDLSRRALAAASGPVDYLLFPETSFSRVEESAVDAAPAFSALLRELPPDRLRYLISGYDGYYRFGPGEAVSPAVRYLPGRNGETVALEALNGAVQFDLRDRSYQTYRKGVFVPGAESFPLRNVLFFLEPLVNSLGGTVAGRGTQAERTPFTGERARIAPVICYESVFGEYFTDYVREGAQAAMIMTNDGWWDNTSGHRQHLWFASLRAIETRRAIVRSANLGACAFIDQRGRILSRTRYDERGFLNGELRLNDALTPYVRFGDLTARVALLLAAMAALTTLARTLRREGRAFPE